MTLESVFWKSIPFVAMRFQRPLGLALADGDYLRAWSNASRFAPLALLVLGGLTGYFYQGASYTISLPLLMLFAGVGALGGGLGGMFLLGYMLGDFFVPPEGVEATTNFRGALLISYALLGFLLIFIPLTATSLRHESLRLFKSQPKLQEGFSFVAQPAFYGLCVFAWINAAPILIRPIYTWRGLNPETEAMQPLQSNGEMIILAALIFSVVRVVLEDKAALINGRKTVAPEILQEYLRLEAKFSKWDWWIAEGVRSALLTVLLSGMTVDLDQWVKLFVALFVCGAIRETLHQWGKFGSGWVKFITSIPILLRIPVLLVICYYVTENIISNNWYESYGFQAVINGVVISAALFAFFTPKQSLDIAPKAEPAASAV